MLGDFEHYLIRHCSAQVEEVKRQVNVEQFWTDLMAAIDSDAFGHSPSDLRRFFLAEEVPTEVELPPEQLETLKDENSPRKKWKSHILWFQPEPVINLVKEYNRRRNADPYLDRSDLRSQMKTRPYWVPEPPPPASSDGTAVHRKYFAGHQKTAWGIKVDFFANGLLHLSPEEWRASLFPKGDGVGIPHDQWVDPRKGDIFGLIDRILKKPNEEDK